LFTSNLGSLRHRSFVPCSGRRGRRLVAAHARPAMLLAVAAAAAAAVALAASAARITSLPGYRGTAADFPVMEAGYTNITNGKHLYYWFFETFADDKANAPLVVWFQGGPGCSSLFGMFSENGPLTLTADGGVERNYVNWVNYAHVLYFEQPVGVGFSVADDPSYYNGSDLRAAADSAAFLQQWLVDHPRYRQSRLWLTGESYGGVYLPTTADVVINSTIGAQLAGLMLGNPVISCADVDDSPRRPGAPEAGNTVALNMLYWHGLVSYESYQRWRALACNDDARSDSCAALWKKIVAQVGDIEQPLLAAADDDNYPALNPDDLYYSFCTGNGTLDFAVTRADSQCSPTTTRITKYLNRADVQRAIHVQFAPLPQKWASCWNRLTNWTQDAGSMIPFVERLFERRPDVNVLYFSGDVDILTVPFGFTHECLSQLANRGQRTRAWQPWRVNRHVAGYWEQFEKYTYATIKGAGHEAPGYQPLTSSEMFRRFLQTGSLADKAPLARAARRTGPPRDRRLWTQATVLKMLNIRP